MQSKHYRKIVLRTKFNFHFPDSSGLLLMPLHLIVFHRTTWGLYCTFYLPGFYVSVHYYVYSPGSRKVFISFGDCLRTHHLSWSLYSMAKIQNYSVLHWDWHCHCINLGIRCGWYIPLSQNLVHFKPSWSLLLMDSTPSHTLTVPALGSELQAWRKSSELGILEKVLFFIYWGCGQ